MLPAQAPQKLNKRLGFVVGEAWSGITSLRWRINGAPPTPDLANIIFEISQNSPNASPLVTLSVTGATIVLSSASGWTGLIPSQVLALPSGEYKWKLKTVTVASVTRTWVTGLMTGEL